MATTIVTKNGSGAPTASDLVAGELAVDLTNKRLYTEDSGGTVLELGTNPTTLVVDTDTLVVDAANNRVGIGTSSPDTLAHLAAGAGSAVLRLENTDAFLSDNEVVGKIEFETQDSGGAGVNAFIQAAGVSTNGATKLEFGTGGSNSPETRMTINSNGNVGIGTIPSYRLHVLDSAADIGLFSSSHATTTNFYITNTNATANNTANLYFGPANAVAGAYISAIAIEDFSTSANRTADLAFYTRKDGTFGERLRISSDGSVGIGTGSPSSVLHLSTSNDPKITLTDTGFGASADITGSNGNLRLNSQTATIFDIADSEVMRIDASGNVLVGTTTTTAGNEGMVYFNGSSLRVTRDSDEPLNLDRLSTDGAIAVFKKDGATVGSIGTSSSSLYIGKSSGAGLMFQGGNMIPVTDGSAADDTYDLGASAVRFDDVYATNGTIQTSDRNEKQDIEELFDAEQRVAVAAKGLLRKFRWKSSVAENGDDARTHFGIIAQDLQAAFEAEGLDAGDYAMFINSTWTDEETGEERSRMGVRYSELLAFIIAAI
jgi:hypothetical protein